MSEPLVLHPEIRLQLQRDEIAGKQQRIGRLEAEITSLRASLDDAYREISRLTAEKHARDVALRRVSEAAESVHAQGERG